MTDLIARVEVAELTATIEAPELKAKVGFTAPVLPDYFQWRQEHFDPYFHLPLNDPPGSTVAKALAGPDGVHEGVVYPGAGGIVRPYTRYPSTRYEEGAGNTIAGDEDTFSFVNRTWKFTIAFWVHAITGPGVRFLLLATSNSLGTNAPGWIWMMDQSTIYIRVKNGSQFSIARYTSSGTLPLAMGPIHVVGVGDGSQLSIFVNGVWIESVTARPGLDSSTQQPLMVTNNRDFSGSLSGLLIDTRPWSPEEVQMDYLRGMGVWE